MGLGAIVVVDAGDRGLNLFAADEKPGMKALLAEPLVCVDVLGHSMLERAVEHFVRADVEVVTVLLAADFSYDVPAFPASFGNVQFQTVKDVSSAVAEKLKEYSQNGIDHAFLASSALYAETDLLDFFFFHREARRMVTRARDRQGALDLWVVDCAAQHSDLDNKLTQEQANGSSYFVGGYARRLTRPHDLRLLISDVLRGRCAIRPSGQAVKAGLWMDEEAEIDRRARIVPPAYIGRGVKIQEDALITRCSSLEEGCYVDCGTVIEDSSILANTHVGIWLDVRHAVANGNKLLSLEHDVVLEISDPNVMRSTRSAGAMKKFVFNAQYEKQEMIADLPIEDSENAPAPETWQLRANPIQG